MIFLMDFDTNLSRNLPVQRVTSYSPFFGGGPLLTWGGGYTVFLHAHMAILPPAAWRDSPPGTVGHPAEIAVERKLPFGNVAGNAAARRRR